MVTFGRNSISWTGNQVKVHADDFPEPFEKSIPRHVYHDYYYINANIFSLLLHLPWLKAKNKPVLINEAILNQSTRASVEKILQQEQLPWLIASETDLGKKLDEESASVLLIDDTAYFANTGETLVDPLFKHGHVQISRFDTKSSQRKYNVFFSFNDIKAEQFSKKINQLDTMDYLNKTQLGIQQYLTWFATNIRGTRVLTRFSHWYHGGSGKHRAEKLQSKIEAALANPAIINFTEFNMSIKQMLRNSSNTRHSLARFISAALTGDGSLETLPDSDFKEIRQKVL